MKSVKLIISILFMMSLSQASSAAPKIFDGNWAGKGTYILSNDVTSCSSFDLQFSATEDQFVFESGQRACDKHKENFYRVPMTYKDGKLYFGGQQVGSYTDDTLEASYRMPDGNSFRTWRMSMRRSGDHLLYEESRTMEGETTPLINFAGLLIIQ